MKDQLNIKIGDYCNYVNSSVKNFLGNNFSDSALNSRKAAEAACKLLIYHAFPAKVAENKILGKTLRELIVTLIKDKIAEKKAINHLETLQLIGNKAAHDNAISKEEAAHCLNALNLFSDYLFSENLKIARPSLLNFELNPEKSSKSEQAPVIEKIVVHEKIIQQKIDKETEEALLEKFQKIGQNEREKYQSILAETQRELLEAQQKTANVQIKIEPREKSNKRFLIFTVIGFLLVMIATLFYFTKRENGSDKESETTRPIFHQLDTCYVAVNALNILQDNPNMHFNIEQYLTKAISQISRVNAVPIKITHTTFKETSTSEKDSLLNEAAAAGYDLVYFGEFYESVLDSNMLEITGAFTNDRDYFRTKKIKFKNLSDSSFIKELNDQSNIALMRYVTLQQEKRPYTKLGEILEPLTCYSPENYASIKGFLAKMKMGARDFKGALKIHNEIQRLLPNDKTVLFYKAVTYTELEKFDSSQFYFNKVLANDPNNTHLLLEYAYLKVKQNDKNEAKNILSKILKLDQNDKTAAQWLADLKGNELNEFFRHDLNFKDKTATEFMKTGNFTIALKFLKEIYLANPEQPGLFGRMAKCYFEIGDKVNALKFATDAVNTDSTKIENTLLYASIMARLSPEKKVRTLRYFELSLKLDAKKIELFDIYSNYLLSQNEIKRCIEICLMGKKIAPNNLNLNYTLGNCYLIQSDYYNAKPCFEIVVIQLPNDYSVQTILASCYLNTVPKVNAAFYKGYACIQNAIALNPNSGTTQLVYARYLQRLGQFAAAKEHYLKAKVLDSEVNDVNLENLLKM